MKIYLKEDCCLEIDEAIFTEPNLSRHAEGADGRNSHILADGEEFNWRDPKFDSSMSKEDYAKEAEALSNAKAGKHEDNSNPEKLEDKIFGWVFHNPKYNTDRKFKVKIPSGPTQFNPHALPELVIYSMDDSTVITYMLLKGPRSLYNYEDQFVKELDEQMIELSEAVDVDYDYQTGDADMKTADVFDINKSDSSYSTGLLPGNKENDYYREHKNKVGEIVYMTANEYYDACAEGFRKLGNDSSVEKLKSGREHDAQDIKDLQKIVVEKGKKLPIPYLDYTKTFAQEGLHRIMAMAELFDWDKTKFPVLVIKYADESKHIEDLKWQDQHKIEQDVIQPSQDFHYHDKEELLDQLKWELERHEYGWEYIEHPENLEIRVDNDADKGITKLTFKDPDSDFEFITDEYTFDFNADNHTDAQIGDLPEDELDAALIADLLLDEKLELSESNLKQHTPYMLRNDGKLFECGKIHPYIHYSDSYPDDFIIQMFLNNFDLHFFYENTLQDNLKKLIRTTLCYCWYLGYELPDEWKSEVTEKIDIPNPDKHELMEYIKLLRYDTNQEWCRVRTSDMFFDGDNDDIYFRISSVGFNWFPLIWKLVADNADSISTVTVAREDTKETHSVGGVDLDHLPTDEFLTLKGNPIIEELQGEDLAPILSESMGELLGGKALIDSFGYNPVHRINYWYEELINHIVREDTRKKKGVEEKDDVGDQEITNAIFNNSADVSAAPISESIEKHETLNPKLWDENNELLPEVKDGIQNVVNQFITELKDNNVELKVLDVILVGSNASYNYTKDSDLDVHIVADTSIIPCEYGLLPIIYNMARSQFNSKYDVTIHGVPIEIYVEDMVTSANSNGIYSLKTGWVKKPVALDIPEIDISDDYPKWEERAENLIKEIEEYLV